MEKQYNPQTENGLFEKIKFFNLTKKKRRQLISEMNVGLWPPNLQK